MGEDAYEEPEDLKVSIYISISFGAKLGGTKGVAIGIAVVGNEEDRMIMGGMIMKTSAEYYRHLWWAGSVSIIVIIGSVHNLRRLT